MIFLHLTLHIFLNTIIYADSNSTFFFKKKSLIYKKFYLNNIICIVTINKHYI